MRPPRLAFRCSRSAAALSLRRLCAGFGPERRSKPPTRPSNNPRPEKDSQRRADDLNEAAKQVAGPAGNPECVWLGRRVVNLLWRDDLDTAFRHLDLYDRFGCPGGHIQATFRCVVRQGNIDPKAPETLHGTGPCLLDQPGLAPRPGGRCQSRPAGRNHNPITAFIFRTRARRAFKTPCWRLQLYNAPLCSPFRGILLRNRCQPRGRGGGLPHQPRLVCVCAPSCCRRARCMRAYGAVGAWPASALPRPTLKRPLASFLTLRSPAHAPDKAQTSARRKFAPTCACCALHARDPHLSSRPAASNSFPASPTSSV